MNTQLQEQLEAVLPEGFSARGARLEDVEAAIKLYNAWSHSVLQRDEFTDPNDIRNEWVSPGFDPAEDIRLVFAPYGELVGYIEVWTNAQPPVHPWIWVRVHPDYDGLNIGAWLIEWAEQRALQALPTIPEGLRFAPRIGIYRQADQSKRLIEELDYGYIRSS